MLRNSGDWLLRSYDLCSTTYPTHLPSPTVTKGTVKRVKEKKIECISVTIPDAVMTSLAGFIRPHPSPKAGPGSKLLQARALFSPLAAQ